MTPIQVLRQTAKGESVTRTIRNYGCPYCGPSTQHFGMCPRIKEIEYHPNGTVKRVVLR